MARIPVSKTLLVGLGGTGQTALAYVKKRMLEAYDGKIPPTIHFVSFDADIKGQEASQFFGGSEFVQMRVKDTQSYVNEHSELLGQWLDIERIPWQNLKNIEIGAGQIRQVGRLALQFYMKDILKIIKADIDSIQSWQANQDERWEVSETTPQVIFFGSIAGGTGGGTLLDLASAVRAMTAGKWEQVAYLMMPGVFIGKPMTYYVEENSYAFLKELDFMMAERAAIVAGDHGDLYSVDQADGVGYQFAYPFDKIMLIDNVSQADVGYDEPSALAEAIGQAIYATTGGPIGVKANSAGVNQPNMGHAWDGGKRCWYSTLGIAELRYPRAEFARFGECAFVSSLVAQMKVGEPPAEGSSISDPVQLKDAFIVEERLQESGEKRNEIVDAILPPRAFQPLLPATISKDVEVEPAWGANKNALTDWVAASNKMAGDNRDVLLKRVRLAVADRVDDFVCSYGGNVAEGFASSLKGYFASIQEEMTKENATAANRVRQLDQAAIAMKAECVEKTRKIFGKREAVSAVLAKYRATLLELARTNAEQARTFEAINFCSGMIVKLDEMSEVLRGQQTSLGNLLDRADQEKTAARDCLGRSKPFEKLVMPDIASIDLPIPSARDFYAWFRVMDQGNSALAFWAKTAEDAFEYLMNYAAKEKDVAANLREQSLASVMASKPDAERDDLLHTLDAMAQPLLGVDTGKVQGRPDEDAPAVIYLIAADSEFRAVFDDPKVANSDKTLAVRLKGLKATTVEVIELADPDRAFFYRRWGAVPAYALSSFRLLKSEYTEMASKPDKWSLHIDKRWGEALPDLDPSSGINEKLWVWALAASDIPDFQRVRRSVNCYSFTCFDVLADGTKVPTVMQLGNGLSVARTAFLSKKEWIAQCEEHILASITQKGNSASKAEIDAYKQRLMADMNGADSNRKPLLRQELEAIATFAAGLR